jgi:hypothetical protein
MHDEPLFLKILLIRSEAQMLFDALPASGEKVDVGVKIQAYDLALEFLAQQNPAKDPRLGASAPV